MPNTIDVETESLHAAAALAASATLVSGVLVNRARSNNVLKLRVAGTGAADVKAEFAVSSDPAGANLGGYETIVASTNAQNEPEKYHEIAIPVLVGPYFKIKITELTGTVADTVVDAQLLRVNT